MNILHVTLGFYPASAWGGPVKIVHLNGKELVRRGHQVTVYCTNLLNKRQRIEVGTFERQVDGMRVVYFNTWNFPRWPGTLGPIWLPDLPSYLQREIRSFDIVHINGYRNLMIPPVTRAAKRAHVPIVVQPHGAMDIIINTFFFKRLYDRILGSSELKGIGALIAAQESERQVAIAHGVPSERITIIPNGLDLTEQLVFPPRGSFRRCYNIPDGLPLILFLGRINKKKGVDMLVEAFNLMENKDAWLAIVGPDDGQLQEVQDLIHKYHLTDRVVLPGMLTGSDMWAAYHDASLYVLPCRNDTFPMTILEACLAEIPMVVTNGCEIAHLIKDRVAEVVPFDPAVFANAIDRLLTDTEKYAAYKMNCPSVMQDTFSLNAAVARIETLYKMVISSTCTPV